jgi:Cdc6-like AAA superfamily ATPase
MQVYKVGEIVNGVVVFSERFEYGGDIIAMLLATEAVANPRSDSAWQLDVPINGRPPIRLGLPPLLSISDSLDEPVLVANRWLVFYRNQLFVPEHRPKSESERDEVIIEVKKRVRGETPEPADPMEHPPSVPENHLRFWIHPALAADLEKRYAGTDAVLPDVAMDRIHVDIPLHFEPPIGPVSVDGFLYELGKLTGLEAVKRDVRSLVNYLRIQELRKEEGLPPGQMAMHLVFTGNPGTGKTTVARILAKIYKAMGFLPEGQLVETDRSGLVGEYLGHTAPKTLQVIQKALGGVLFIDEAYALARTVHGQKDMFGLEAIDTLLKAMEDNRDRLVVIVAGYPNEMKQFIASNPGLRSRFARYINFPDYTPAELMQIFEQQASDAGYMLSEGARNRAGAIFEAVCESRGEGFGNGRWVRTMFERTSVNLSDRLANDTNITREHLMTLQESDVESMLE